MKNVFATALDVTTQTYSVYCPRRAKKAEKIITIKKLELEILTFKMT